MKTLSIKNGKFVFKVGGRVVGRYSPSSDGGRQFAEDYKTRKAGGVLEMNLSVDVPDQHGVHPTDARVFWTGFRTRLTETRTTLARPERSATIGAEKTTRICRWIIQVLFDGLSKEHQATLTQRLNEMLCRHAALPDLIDLAYEVDVGLKHGVDAAQGLKLQALIDIARTKLEAE